jgi:hypothetical protein
MEPEQFFYYLLEKAKIAFYLSPISQKQFSFWGASVCDTQIKKNQPILAGINWGGKKDYGFQTTYPLVDKTRKYNFLRKVPQLLREHFGIEKIDDINYCNVCFFRTPSEELLETKDWELSIPLFEEYVKYINPNYVIILGRTPIIMLKKLNKIDDIERKFVGVRKNYRVYTGKLFGIYNLFGFPHPNTQIDNESLSKIWSIPKTFDKLH